MINTAEKEHIYDRVNDFYIVMDWISDSQFNSSKKRAEENLKEKKLHFILIADEEVKSKFDQVTNITVLTKKSFNVLGKLKRPDELSFLATNDEKVIVYFCTEINKLVNKLRKTISHGIHVSYMNEKMTNFDLTFRVDLGNEGALLNQTKKYLKRL